MEEKKRVLVTGASRGIGRAIALRLARDGYDVTINYHRNQAAACSVLNEISNAGGSAGLLQFDVSNRDQCKEVLARDVEDKPCYFGVVHNAGISRDNAFPAMSGDEWDLVMRTNLDSFYNVLNPLTMPMIHRRKPGRIVTMTSVSGQVGNRGQANYAASKGGIIAASQSLAIELAKRNITVNCISPGLIETEMTEQAPVEEILKMIPLKRLGQASDIAGVAAFLLSDDAAYITRQVIGVNGGLIP